MAYFDVYLVLTNKKQPAGSTDRLLTNLMLLIFCQGKSKPILRFEPF